MAIAGVLVRDFQNIEQLLTPILGPRGVAALYQRSLHLTRATHPWLAQPAEIAQPAIDLMALRTLFEQQDRTAAAAAATALLQSFHDLLASLIGHPLTERLLGPVWAHSPGPTAAQDISP